MHGVYAALEREGKIGPFTMVDGKLAAKPHQEYPKWVTRADGSRVIVKDLAEEAKIAAAPTEAGAPDPLSDAKAKLASESEALEAQRAELAKLQAEMKASLAELEVARAGIQAGPGGHVAAKEPSLPPKPGGPTTFRLPKDASK